MFVDASLPLRLKRRRFTNVDPMEAQEAQAKLDAAKEKFGRVVRVFETSPVSSEISSPVEGPKSEESDEFYEFGADDYFRIMKKEDKYLKTRKLREAEEAARRSKFTKAVMRIRFPDNHTLEATFHPSEKIQSLLDLLVRVIASPELPFYIYTTPPKKLIKDASQDFYSAGFIPGAIVYFAYDIPKGNGDAASGPFLQDEIMALKGLEVATEPEQPPETKPEEAVAPPKAVVEERKPVTDKKAIKPKWLKM